MEEAEDLLKELGLPENLTVPDAFTISIQAVARAGGHLVEALHAGGKVAEAKAWGMAWGSLRVAYACLDRIAKVRASEEEWTN